MHLSVLNTAQTPAGNSEKKEVNPYEAFDEKLDQFGVTVINGPDDNVLAPNQKLVFNEYWKRRTILYIRDAFNSKYNLSSKLAGKIFYYLTNGYMPEKRGPGDILHPFIITPQKIDIGNLSPYSSESLSVTIKLREGISKAEVIDIIPSSDQILTLFCSKDALIKKPSCSQTIYDTDDKNITIVINYKIIPKKLGLSHFRLYLLCKINDSYLTVVTIVGQYLVNRSVPFTFHFYNPHFLIRYGKTYYNYLWVKNQGSTSLKVSDIIGFGNQLGLNYPPNFKKKHFNQQPISNELRKRLEEAEPTFWNIPPKEERPIIEMFFLTLSRKEMNSDAIISNNKTKSSYSTDTDDVILPVDDVNSNNKKAEQRSEQMAVDINKEQEWPNLEFNIFKLVIDSKMYYLNLLTYFNHDIKFWEHESINVGVFCSRFVRHEVSVYVSNRLEKAAVLNAINVEQENPDFIIEIASFYKHALILPFADEKFLLLKLLVHYKGKEDFAVLKANLVAKLDLANEKYTEKLPIYASFVADFFEVNEKGKFVVDSETKDFEVSIRQNVAAELIVNKIDIIRGSKNDELHTVEYVWEKNITVQKHIFVAKEYKPLMNLKFKFTNEDIITNFKNEYLVIIYAMENIFTVKLNFFYKIPLCSKGKFSKIKFRCDKNPILNFGIFSTTTSTQFKTRSVRLYNKLPSEIFIKKMEILMTHPTFLLKVNLTHYFDGDKIQSNSVYMSNTTQRENINLLMLKAETCTIDISVQLVKNEYVKQMGVHFIFPIRFTMSDGKNFVINASFQFVHGKISYRPHVVNVNLIFPGPVLSRSFKITSTFAEELNFEDTMISGPSKDMIHIYQMDRSFEDSLNDMLIRFSLDPNYIQRTSSFYSQTNQTDDALCLWDVEKYNNTHMLWQKLVKEGLDKINGVIHVVTNLKKNIKIAVRGKIKYPELVKIPLVLENNNLGLLTYHSVTIKNVFRKRMKVRLFLAPQSFLSMDSIDDEIISLIEKQTKPDGQNIICIEHTQISSENIKFFTRRLYLENLQFINHPKPHLSSANHACFKFPDTAADRERFFLNFKSTTNFFFKFSQFNDKQDRSELLSKHLILIDDIHKYSNYDAPLSEIPSNLDESRNLSPLEYLWDLANFVYGCKSVISSWMATKTPKPIEKPNVIFLNHVKAMEEYLAKKNVFLNPQYKEKSFVIPPLGSLTIKDALVVKSNSDGSFNNVQVNLLIKNNITAIYKVPIVLKKSNIKFEQVNVERPEDLSIFGSSNVLYFSIASDSFRLKVNRRNKTLVFYRRPIIRIIELRNAGASSVRITKASFSNGRLRKGCLELFPLQPKTINPGQSIRIKMIVFFCRKLNSHFNEPLVLHSTIRPLNYRLVIKLDGFYVGSNERKILSSIFWYLQNLVYVLFILRFVIHCFRKKKSVAIDITAKKVNAVFIPEASLKEKLLVYNCRLNPSDFELSGRLSSLSNWLNIEKEMLRFKSVNEPENDAKVFQLQTTKKGDKKKKNLHKILKEKHHYSHINTNNPVENSYMSVEQICQMLDHNKSSSEEKHDRRRKLISQAEFSKEEINRIENKFGSIGERLGGREEVSNSSFQTDHLNDISHSKVKRGNYPVANLNPETMVYSFINKKQLEEEDEEYDMIENSKDFEQEIKEHDQLGQLFDIAPLTTPKPRTGLNFYSQKFVSFKMDDYKYEASNQKDRKRTNTDANTFVRKNSEQSYSDHQKMGSSKIKQSPSGL